MAAPLRFLVPSIRPFVEKLLKSDLLTSHELDVEIICLSSGLSASLPYQKSDNLCDRFRLVLPFAGFCVVWEVIFDGSSPDSAPDFIFDDDSFLCASNFEDFNDIPSLINWDSSDSNALVNVISDLLRLYTKFEFNTIQNGDMSLSPYIGKWIDLDNIKDNDWKVEILNGNRKTNSILSPRLRNSLPYGSVSVLVNVPVHTEEPVSETLQFVLQYIIKSHNQQIEEKICCSPDLESWLKPFLDIQARGNRWLSSRGVHWDVKNSSLSVAAESFKADMNEILLKSIHLYHKRQCLLVNVLHNVLGKRDELGASLLEFDFANFKFSAYLLLQNCIFMIDFRLRTAKGILGTIADDGSVRSIKEFSEDELMDPDFDITEVVRGNQES